MKISQETYSFNYFIIITKIFLDKMFYLVDSIFDPINICGRFVFLEVNSQALSKKVLIFIIQN